jgi:hypothetical protein
MNTVETILIKSHGSKSLYLEAKAMICLRLSYTCRNLVAEAGGNALLIAGARARLFLLSTPRFRIERERERERE